MSFIIAFKIVIFVTACCLLAFTIIAVIAICGGLFLIKFVTAWESIKNRWGP